MFRHMPASMAALAGFFCLAMSCQIASAGDAVFEGRLDAVNIKQSMITVDGIELSVVPKTVLLIDGKPAKLKDLAGVQQVTVEYEDELAVVRSVTVGEAGGKKPQPAKRPKLTLSLLKQHVAVINKRLEPKTSWVTLEYGFLNQLELKDFRTDGKAPTLANGVLNIPANTDVTHVVPFRHMKVQAHYFIENMTNRRNLFSLSGGATLEYHKPGRPTRFFLSSNGVAVAEAIATEGTWPRPVSLEYAPGLGTLDVKVADDELGGKVQIEEAGAITFHGGSGGLRIASLVIEGVPTDAWIKGL